MTTWVAALVLVNEDRRSNRWLHHVSVEHPTWLVAFGGFDLMCSLAAWAHENKHAWGVAHWGHDVFVGVGHWVALALSVVGSVVKQT